MIAIARHSILSSSILLVFATAGHAQQRPMTFVDLLNVPNLTDPQLSPDGRRVAYVLSAADWEANRRTSHIWLIDVDSSEATQLTFGPEGESSPRWAPDGKTIAFLAKRGSDDATQVYLLSTAGGEARPLTRHPVAVSNIEWGRDGTTIYFLASDPKPEALAERHKRKDDVFALDEEYEQRHLWRASVPAGNTSRVTEGDYSILDYQISSDGRRIAHHRSGSPLRESSDASEVWVMDSNGAGAVQLTHNSVPESGAQVSPDGRQVMFVAGANEEFDSYHNGTLFVVPSTGGDARVVAPIQPFSIDAAAWGPQGASVYFVANMGVHSQLHQLDLASGNVRQLTDGKHALGNWTYVDEAARHVLTIKDAVNNGDAYLVGNTGEATRVTRVFDYLARDFDLPAMEKVEWNGVDGVTVEGMLYYPLGFRQGQRYPLVVQTHGGPRASDKYGFGGWADYIQVLTARGYMVLKPNYRGSTGYGDEFLRDMVGHYFRYSHLDVMAGVDSLVARGLVDNDRLAKMGWSAGGHMTNKIITHTDRFKAASSGAGASNWISMYAQSDTRVYRTPWFGATPWQEGAPIDLYWEHSPLKYASRVTTPTLFLVGDMDIRVPPPQSVEMYRALKSNGVPTRLYIAPREPHVWQELRHQLFKMNVELDWFERHVMNRTHVWETPPGEAIQKSTHSPQ